MKTIWMRPNPPSIEGGHAEAEHREGQGIASEYPLIRRGQVVFTYFHFASSEALTEAMVNSGAICIAYETVESEDGSLPVDAHVRGGWSDGHSAGRQVSGEAAQGRGVLLGGVLGVPPGRVLVLGGGVSGTYTAKMAAGLGAHVTIMDINMDRLRRVNDIMPHHVVTEYSNVQHRQAIASHDLIVGAVLIKGAKHRI